MPAPTQDQDLLTDVLRDVSRSFYLTLRVLPRSVRRSIGVAYLLARATDTLADTEIIPPGQRVEALRELGAHILSDRRVPLDYRAFIPSTGATAEHELLRRVNEVLAAFQGLSDPDQIEVREVLGVIISGQQLDLQRFGSVSAGRVVALEADEELDDYTWRVAGCVGRFWTRLCCRHLFADNHLRGEALEDDGVRFGKGLQLINILRDLPADLRLGRCYVPSRRLDEHGLQPAALACAWPILIGAHTLSRLWSEPILDPTRRVKISRADVRRILLGSLLRLGRRRAWQRQFGEAIAVRCAWRDSSR